MPRGPFTVRLCLASARAPAGTAHASIPHHDPCSRATAAHVPGPMMVARYTEPGAACAMAAAAPFTGKQGSLPWTWPLALACQASMHTDQNLRPRFSADMFTSQPLESPCEPCFPEASCLLPMNALWVCCGATLSFRIGGLPTQQDAPSTRVAACCALLAVLDNNKQTSDPV